MRMQEQANAEEANAPITSMKKVSGKRESHEAAKLRIRAGSVSRAIMKAILLQNDACRCGNEIAQASLRVCGFSTVDQKTPGFCEINQLPAGFQEVFWHNSGFTHQLPTGATDETKNCALNYNGIASLPFETVRKMGALRSLCRCK